jgi:mannose/fructose/N-acetylgalactosamine-specific phosphotransferase system component IIC
MSPLGELVSLGLLGGFVALDGTSVGQFMLSRPLVAGTLAGAILGSPADGFLVGTLLEIYLLVSFPVGGSRFPEGGPAAVIAASVAAASPEPGAIAMGMAIGLIWGQLAGFSVSWLRKVNTHLAPDPAGGSITAALVVRGHLTAVALDFLRGAVVTGAGVWTARLFLPLVPLWPLADADTKSLLLVGGTVSLGILLRSYGGFKKRGALFAGGLFLGLLWGTLL